MRRLLEKANGITLARRVSVIRVSVPLAAAALTLVAYAAIQAMALTAPWFPADDAQQLAFVRGLEGLGRLFGVDSFGLFRPVKNLLFLLFAWLEPLGMPAVRLLAIALGLATYFPVRAFFRCVFGDERYALLGAAIWLLAPTLVSSVVWLSCVNIQLMCGFAAAAFVCHDRGRPVWTSLCLFLACVSYESAVAIGPCLVVFDFFLRAERFRARRTWGRYALYAMVTLVFLAVRHLVGSVHAVNGSFANCSRFDIVCASASFVCQHFLSWLWPFGRMTVFGGYAAGSVPTATLVASWVLVVACVILALALRRRRPAIGFGLAFALVGFLPVSNVTGVGNGPYGDYYLGIASLGLAAALVGLCQMRLGRFLVPIWRLAAVAAAFHWAWLWADGDRAYFAAAENFPSFFGNHLILVERLANVGCFKEALQLGRDVEAMVGSESGQMSQVYLVRALYEIRETKDAERALALLEKSRKTNDFGGPLQDCSYYVGCVYEDLLNDAARAERLYAAALRHPWTVNSVPVADRLARLWAERGRRDEAIALWRRVLKMQPGNATVRHNLRIALEGEVRTDGAVP